ncbi:Hint domain-containing protein [Histidinibacterium aquaticum]|nr:Hint domain-containing protein [Histidinibacterium aquaticum]
MYRWIAETTDRRENERTGPETEYRLEPGTAGILAGTKVATGRGWTAVENLKSGDEVLTFDGGLQRLRGVHVFDVWAGAENDVDLWPLRVPEGALGNREEITILPGQAVLIESDIAEDVFGDPFALLPAAALEMYRGISRVKPTRSVRIVTLDFESGREEIVFGNLGALFHVPVGGSMLQAAMAEARYQVLSMGEADALVEALIAEEGFTPTETSQASFAVA